MNVKSRKLKPNNNPLKKLNQKRRLLRKSQSRFQCGQESSVQTNQLNRKAKSSLSMLRNSPSLFKKVNKLVKPRKRRKKRSMCALIKSQSNKESR